MGQTPLLIESNKKQFREKKHQSNHNSQNANKKGPTREEVFAKIDSVVSNLLAKESTNEAIEQWKEECIPSKMTQTAVTYLFKVMIDKGRFFSKVKFSLFISTTFEFSRQKLETKLLENGTFQSMPNLKWWIFDIFKHGELRF